jgi:hypothetical protein
MINNFIYPIVENKIELLEHQQIEKKWNYKQEPIKDFIWNREKRRKDIKNDRIRKRQRK